MLKVINNFQIMSNNNDTSQDCRKQSSSMRNSVEQLLDQILVQVIQEEEANKEAKMNKLKAWQNKETNMNLVILNMTESGVKLRKKFMMLWKQQ